MSYLPGYVHPCENNTTTSSHTHLHVHVEVVHAQLPLCISLPLSYPAERQEYARRSRASEEVMRDRMVEAKSMIDEEKISKKELSYGKGELVLATTY